MIRGLIGPGYSQITVTPRRILKATAPRSQMVMIQASRSLSRDSSLMGRIRELVLIMASATPKATSLMIESASTTKLPLVATPTKCWTYLSRRTCRMSDRRALQVYRQLLIIETNVSLTTSKKKMSSNNVSLASSLPIILKQYRKPKVLAAPNKLLPAPS